MLENEKPRPLAARSRPKRPLLRAENIPRELQELPRWVCWSYNWSQRKKKWDKPPCQLDGAFASCTDTMTWCSFDDAVRAIGMTNRFDGIGLALVGDGLTAIDLDSRIADDRSDVVRDGDLTGVETWARAIIIELNSYTELSPSARGIRIFVRATIPARCGNRKACFEAYDRARYVTVTGDRIVTMPRTIEQRHDALDALLAHLLPQISNVPAPETPIATSDDDELLERARTARNGFRFEALFDRGELVAFGGDHSRADLALCSMIAFWSGPDSARIDRVFRRSALYRRKWDERHCRTGESYGQMTVARALRRR